MTETCKPHVWIDPVLRYTADEMINLRHKSAIYVSNNEHDSKYNNEYLVNLLEKYPGYKTIQVGTVGLMGCVYRQTFKLRFISAHKQIEDLWFKNVPTLLIFDNQTDRSYYRYMDKNGFKVITAESSFYVTVNNDTENLSKGNTEHDCDADGIDAMDNCDRYRMDVDAKRYFKNLTRVPRIVQR